MCVILNKNKHVSGNIKSFFGKVRYNIFLNRILFGFIIFLTLRSAVSQLVILIYPHYLIKIVVNLIIYLKGEGYLITYHTIKNYLFRTARQISAISSFIELWLISVF